MALLVHQYVYKNDPINYGTFIGPIIDDLEINYKEIENKTSNSSNSKKNINNFNSMKIEKDCVGCYGEDKYQTFEKNFKEPKGLNNKEGNCYMNSLLQCFYYCRPMTNFFLSSKDKCRLGLISKSYYDFVHCLHSGSSDAALSFQKVMMRDYFKLNEEKDSKELAIFILSKLNEE